MKIEWRLFGGAAGFFAVTGTLYWLVTYEWAGAVMLAACVLAFAMVAGWLLVQSRRHGPRPEDRDDASLSEASEDVGYFPSRSIWPFVIASGAVLVSVGLVFSFALVALGGVMLGISVVGYTYEAQSKP